MINQFDPHLFYKQIIAAVNDRASSSMADPAGVHHDGRRGSVVSNAPSEGSRSELGTRGGRKGEDGAMTSYVVHQQPKNYFKNVSENKEISKLQSLLSTSINSTKKVRHKQPVLVRDM